MSLMFGVTAAAGSGGVTPPDSHTLIMSSGDVPAGSNSMGWYRGAAGSINPDTGVRGAKVDTMFTRTSLDVGILTILIAGHHAQNFFDTVTLTGNFYGGHKTLIYSMPPTGYGQGTYEAGDVGGNTGPFTSWEWSFSQAPSYLINPNEIYDVAFDWTNP